MIGMPKNSINTARSRSRLCRKSNPCRDRQGAGSRFLMTPSAIEVAPGKYDWRDYDRMMDLAAQNGSVITAEFITDTPEWMFRKYPYAGFRSSDGAVEVPAVWNENSNKIQPRPHTGLGRSECKPPKTGKLP